MSLSVSRVRELEIRYRPVKLALPVAGRAGSPREAAQLAAAILADATVEKAIALHFDTKRHLVGVHTISIGTLDSSLVHPREVFKAAFLTNAASLIFAHNHPSGDPTPSADDRALVRRLAEAGALLGVDLDDALIVADAPEGPCYYSFKAEGVL